MPARSPRTQVDDERKDHIDPNRSRKGTAPNHYRPITCSPMMRKIVTAQKREEIYFSQTSRGSFSEGQIGWRKWSRAKGELLYFDQQILNESKTTKKAYYMVLQSWKTDRLKMYKISHKDINFISSGSCPFLFKVLTLNVAICIVYLHFRNFCLSFVVNFSNTKARAPNSAGHIPFLPSRRAMQFGHVVWVWVMFIFRWLFLFSSTEASLIHEQQN